MHNRGTRLCLVSHARRGRTSEGERGYRCQSKPHQLCLREQEEQGLLQITRHHRSKQQVVLRARIVLAAAQGSSNAQIARELDVGVDTVRLWRDRYAPHLSNYPAAAGGRTFPSAAGFHTSEIFFTDDSGTFIFQTRDAPALVQRAEDGVEVTEKIVFPSLVVEVCQMISTDLSQ